MGINTNIFLFIYLPSVLIIYYLLSYLFASANINKIWIIGSSLLLYFFFCSSAIIYILISFIINFAAGFVIYKKENKFSKFIFFIAVIINIILWIYVKYHIELVNAYDLLYASYHKINTWIVPVGFGLITIQQISFLSDCHKKKISKINILDYLTFSSFFPKLIAGPIVPYNDFILYLNFPNFKIYFKNISLGLYLFFIGLFLKVILADTFITIADNGITSHSLNFVQSWVTALCNTFGIFFDISGYTYMAIGLGLFFNIKLPNNFKYPFKALNIREYWERWHITFTSFFANNILEPIVGKKKENSSYVIGVIAMFLTMSVWHKLNLPIIVWALINAFALITFSIFKKIRFKTPDPIAWLATFGFINISWLFFRAENLKGALMVFSGMTNIKTLFVYYNEFYILWGIGANFIIVLLLILSFYIVAKMKNVKDISDNFILSYRTLFITILLVIFSIAFNSANPFIYYGF